MIRAWGCRVASVARLALAGMLVLGAGPQAQAYDEKWVSQALKAAMKQARTAKDVSGYGVFSGGFCLLGGWLERGKTLSFETTLKKGKEYIFVAAGDADVTDLDLSVKDKSSEDAMEDTEDDNTPWVWVGAESDLRVTVTVTLYSTKEAVSDAFALLVVLESGGMKGSLDKLASAGQDILRATGAVAKNEDFDIERSYGQMSLFGAMLKDGSNQSFPRPFTQGQLYSIIGHADANCKDFDLVVTEEGSETTVAEDTATDAIPVVTFVPKTSKRLRLKFNMFSADRPSFAVAAIMSTPRKDDE